MGTYRKRFNEKARSGHMARVKELKRVRNKQFFRHIESNDEGINDREEAQPVEEDSNSEVLKPLTNEEKALKKRKLEELFTPKESKISKLKKKRLDKFIEHQLKREEKKVIIEKLQDYKIDTKLLTSSKTLGHGRQTKKEEFAEALSLEKQGRSNEHTKEILYEEHETKNWDEEDHSNTDMSDEDNFEDTFGDTGSTKSSGFIDHRPSSQGGTGGFGFGFSNVTVVKKEKVVSKRKYNWRQKVEIEEKRKHGIEDEQDFMSSDKDDDSEDEDNRDISDLGSSEIEADDDEEIISDDDSSDTSEEEKELTTTVKSESAENFKEWANQEIKRIEGRDENLSTPILLNYTPIVREEDLDDGLTETAVHVDSKLQRKAFYVQVERSQEIQETRMNLPVFGEEHKLMEAIHHNDVVIICGETGSGKTTQVPQFLFEAGYGSPDSPENPGMIGITQPRRVAAVSMASRVAAELGNYGNKVAHQIRFDTTVKDDTRMKFMTDGVLLREMMHDFKLTKYSSIIIDEAHERNINTDILIGMLSRCVKLRAADNLKDLSNKKLKLIIMSATLRVADFSENSTLFSTPPPVLSVAARQFPVSVHFNRRTSYEYAEEAFKKTCKIHRRLPPGAILIFMTGQQEITHMVKKLRKEFPFPDNTKRKRDMDKPLSEVRINAKTADLETEDIEFSVNIQEEQEFDDGFNPDADDYEEHSDVDEGFEETLEEGQSENDPLYVLPLYSLLPTREQMRVFQSPPAGSRLCIVATNVAETSLTIPGIRYVVDCGRSKERKYNESNGVQSFEIGWVSKASADQRSGRAGRTGPGHCYRLYSSAVYERDFDLFSEPEILRMPVESVVLQMKSMAIHNIVNFPFPTPPNRLGLSKAVTLLQYLGALDTKEKITEDGKKMSLFPLSPRFSKILLVSNENSCLPYVVAIVSALSVGNPFMNEHELGLTPPRPVEKAEGADEKAIDIEPVDIEKQRNLRAKFYKSRARFGKLDKESDVFCLLSAVSAMDFIPFEQREQFIKNNFLKSKLMDEIAKLRKQLMYIIKSNTSKESIAVAVRDEDLKTDIPNEVQIKLLKQMICAGFVDQIAIRADYLYPEEATITNRTPMINIPYVPVLSQKDNDVTATFCYIHPSSRLVNSGQLPPKYLVYNSLHLSGSNKTRLNTLCDIKSTPLANIARNGSMLTYGKPLTGQGLKAINLSTAERYCYVVPRFGATVDSDLKIGWDLNPVAVHQVKENGQWKVTKFVTNKSYKTMEKTQKA